MIKGPFEFDAPTLVSALRIATANDYPELRKFSIERLEKWSLLAIQRIELARDFDLTAWKDSAYKGLWTREEVIKNEEARVLGTDMMEEVAKAQEEENHKRKKEIGAQDKRLDGRQRRRQGEKLWNRRSARMKRGQGGEHQ